jgi:hypothetical protein
VTVTGLEPADVELSGGIACNLASFGGLPSAIGTLFDDMLLASADPPFCAAPGPDILAPCADLQATLTRRRR